MSETAPNRGPSVFTLFAFSSAITLLTVAAFSHFAGLDQFEVYHDEYDMIQTEWKRRWAEVAELHAASRANSGLVWAQQLLTEKKVSGQKSLTRDFPSTEFGHKGSLAINISPIDKNSYHVACLSTVKLEHPFLEYVHGKTTVVAEFSKNSRGNFQPRILQRKNSHDFPND